MHLLKEHTAGLTTFQGTVLPLAYSLDKLAQQVSPRQFFRVNRQYLISRAALATVQTYSAGWLKLTLRPAARYDVFVSSEQL